MSSSISQPCSSSSSSSSSFPSSSSSLRCSLVDALPEDTFLLVCEYLSTLDILKLLCRPVSHGLTHALRRLTECHIDLDGDLKVRAKKRTEAHLSIVPFIRHTFPSLTKLCIKHANDKMDDREAQLFLTQYRDKLTHLDLTDSAIKVLDLSACPAIQSVIISQCTQFQSIIFSATSCTHLNYLDISKTFVNDYDLVKLLLPIKQLRGLKLRSCKNIQLNAFLNNEPVKQQMLQIFKNLYQLDLTHTATTDEFISELSRFRSNSNITENTNNHTSAVEQLFSHSEEELEEIEFESCAQLRSLVLNSCQRLKSPYISFPYLTSLSMVSCSSLKNPIIQCPFLEEINFEASKMTDQSFNLILQGVMKTKRKESSSLKEMSIAPEEKQSHSSSTASTSSVKDNNDKVEYYPLHLRSINIRLCYKIISVATPLPLAHLTSLDSLFSGLSATSLNNICLAAPNLQSINVHHFPVVEHRNYRSLIQKFNISSNSVEDSEINDSGLYSFLSTCSSTLTSLSVRHCQKIFFHDDIFLSRQWDLHTLKYLDVSSIFLEPSFFENHITDARLPKLQILVSEFIRNLSRGIIIKHSKVKDIRLQHTSMSTLTLCTPSLQALDITGCSSLSMVHIAPECAEELSQSLRAVQSLYVNPNTLKQLKELKSPNWAGATIGPDSFSPKKVYSHNNPDSTAAHQPLRAFSQAAYQEYLHSLKLSRVDFEVEEEKEEEKNEGL